ncbi:hypothetical protein A2Z33_05605 [Candidatus Gottesmanbacteria bacterium RBG_16_52_11]|uniref:NAD-dependent epimerase/dehydratase domain-containing protein n=1 Tax=Candidatus Gottesmanbacteria bacterium RBG_16_52_11 TaxID=1798374 RepID=A0A1F5YNZ8_9BACT|nr:MAG: hypothetical protein A2Z33_05605 [Candidatus Gottesmanbacteria bacterium RBG_16_52_11]
MKTQFTSLVTGGAGFIGSHLTDSLVRRGHQVICADNLITGKKENLTDALSSGQATLIEADITEIELKVKPDFIFHLASPASVPDYQKWPLETARANSVGTWRLLELADACGARFLFTSTSEVYGNPKEHPQKESYWGNVNPVGIRSCYDESKRFGEMLTLEYVRSKHADGRVVRIFNTYGPRMRPDDGRVVSNFINQSLAGLPLTVYGNGSQTRSFCYVDDMVRGIEAAMFTDQTTGEVINLGNPQELSVLSLAEKVLSLTGSGAGTAVKKLPEDDPEIRCPDISKAGQLLSWKPEVTLEEGLRKTIAYYRSLMKP